MVTASLVVEKLHCLVAGPDEPRRPGLDVNQPSEQKRQMADVMDGQGEWRDEIGEVGQRARAGREEAEVPAGRGGRALGGWGNQRGVAVLAVRPSGGLSVWSRET